jgi:hypothetical protein
VVLRSIGMSDETAPKRILVVEDDRSSKTVITAALLSQ